MNVWSSSLAVAYLTVVRTPVPHSKGTLAHGTLM